MLLHALLVAQLSSAPVIPAQHYSLKQRRVACSLGALLLGEAPDSGVKVADVAVYDDQWKVGIDEVPASSIFDACPALRRSLPPNRRLATDSDRARAKDWQAAPPLTLYAISAPTLDKTGNVATLATGYICPGLCAGIFRSQYTLHHGKWVLSSPPQLRIIS